jgi:hypothetical protein
MQRWSTERAEAWGREQPWLFGANFVPSTAINQLEMWQEATFDPATIERELGYAQGIGMNVMRVFLHDLLWEHDREGFVERIDRYLAIADAKGIRTMFVFFDDCWHGDVSLGPQPDPVPYAHNSGWLQSPGHAIAEDPAQWPRLERYVKGVLERFGADARVVVWDLYNEPGNQEGPGAQRRGKSIPLLDTAFGWARSVEERTQPVTVADWWPHEDMERCIFGNCDIVSFHSYDPPERGLAEKLDKCLKHGRPVVCTEYMARTHGSTFAACMPLLKQRCAGAINWGLVAGKTQTIYPWGWNKDKGEPPAYFHDVFNPDGTFLYAEEEQDIRRVLAGASDR